MPKLPYPQLTYTKSLPHLQLGLLLDPVLRSQLSEHFVDIKDVCVGLRLWFGHAEFSRDNIIQSTIQQQYIFIYRLYILRISENLTSMTTTLLIIIVLIQTIKAFYDVPSYYGHFSRIFFNVGQIRSGKFKYFQYQNAVDMDSSNQTIYYANRQQHCIELFDLVNRSKRKFAGNCGISGNRVGGVDVMLLNGPSSVVSYQFNQQSYQSQNNMRMLIVANKSCLLTQPGCILSDKQAQSIPLGVNNLLPYPPIIQFPQVDKNNKKYLYISDTGNHCIKMVDMQLESSSVVAGKCGASGFTDGPFGYNRLNRPTSLGITRTGILYFYDEGNQYMRKLSPNGQVLTLKNGACKQFGVSRKVAGYSFRNVLCYDNWVQKQTKAPYQHYIDISDINVCTSHSSNC